jgi:hypothetical protein
LLYQYQKLRLLLNMFCPRLSTLVFSFPFKIPSLNIALHQANSV